MSTIQTSDHAGPLTGRRGAVWVGTFLPAWGKDGELRAAALIDHADFEELSKYRWHIKRDGYLYRNLSHRTEGRGAISLHRHIMGLSRGDPAEVDHINRNRLDNRRVNLRLTDSTGNKQNIGLRRSNTSGFKGVHFHKPTKRWRARAHDHGKEISLGYHETAEEAAEVAAEYRRKHYACATENDR